MNRAARCSVWILIWALVLLLSSGCGGKEPGRAKSSRFDAVVAKPGPAAEDVAGRWCDFAYPSGAGPQLVLPKLTAVAPGEPVPAWAPGRWTWVNLWASWCVPCKRELPLLATWGQHLHEAHIPIDFWYLSVDAKPQDLAQFLRNHPGVTPGRNARVASPADLESWLKKYLKDPGAGIPIQVLADPAGRIRCIRTGGLQEGDYSIVRGLIEGR